MIKNITITFLLLCNAFWSVAQSSYITFGSDHKLRINSNGCLGINLTDLSPASWTGTNQNNAFLAQAGLWIIAEDEDGNIHSAVHRISHKDSFDFWPGPIDTLTRQAGNINEWDNVWQVSADEIESHIANVHSSGYQVPKNIAEWPAEGSDNFSPYLAPFVDVNNNDIYDPENGDYPSIKGDEVAYCIFNDIAKEHTASFGPELVIEVLLMAYKFDYSPNIGLEYFIINRGTYNYKNVKVGFFMDGQCGNPNDNFSGTYANYPKSIFIYNADSIDEGYFEKETPYVIASFTNDYLSSSIVYTNQTPIDSTPKSLSDFIYYSESKWTDGTPLTFGGTGQSTGSPTNYIFAKYFGRPELDWEEKRGINIPGQRSILGSTAYTNFNQNNHIKLDIVLDAGTLKGISENPDLLYNQGVENYYLYRQTTNIKKIGSSTFSIFPNPNNGQFTVTNKANNFSLEIIDNQGHIILSEKNIKNNTWQCNVNLPLGIYYLKLTTEQGIEVKKLCITN